MTDSGDPQGAARPRPQYGEYATPEEQRARIQQPAPWQVEALTPEVAEAPGGGIPSPSNAETAPRRHPVDRIVTFALLAYGLLTVIQSVPAFLDYAAYAETLFRMLGVDAPAIEPGTGSGWGIAASLVLGLGWIATAAVSWWNVRRGRLSWWIPVVGGVVFTGIAGTLMALPLVSDPALMQTVLDGAGLGG